MNKYLSRWLTMLWIMSCLLPPPVAAAPPIPDLAAEATAYLAADLPVALTLIDVQARDGDTLTVCVHAPTSLLQASDGMGVERIEETVRVALTPVTWRVLYVQAQDTQTGICRPLSDFLPHTETTRFPAPHSPLPSSPSPSLSGKTIYLSAGHGWQWGPDYNVNYSVRWSTQRGIYQNIIEDHNNAEVVNQYLVPYLENAGATVVTVRERDWNTTRVIADNDAGAPTYTERGVWKTSTVSGYADRTYRLATTVTGTATSTATWALTVPVAGDYALYAWVRPFVDRAPDAHYTVHTAAGTREVRLNQAIGPQTWRYVGTFPFASGLTLVTLDNHSTVSGATVMADAVRIGGGLFDSVSGIQTYASAPPHKPWWESATYYYAQWMGLDPDNWSYFNDIVARPMFARWNQATGLSTDALYLSWHTNGYNGTIRGTESYIYNGSARTAGSWELQQAVHNELIHDIRAGWESDWTDRGKKQANLGEIRALWDDNPAARMPGILLEVAFHDEENDTNALKDPRFAELSARAVYQGIVHYFETRDGVDLVELPEPPTHLRVQNIGGNAVQVAWAPPATDTLGLVGDAATGYRLYTSPDGFAWAAPISVSSTVHTLTELAASQTLYVYVTAVNAGGESLRSEVLGARMGAPTGNAALLIVNGFDKLTRFGLYTDDDTLVGSSQRLWLERLNSRDYVVHHGDAVPARYAWDSASNEAVAAGMVDLGQYPMVDWLLGEESTEIDGTLNVAERAALTAYLDNDGALLISGTEWAWDLVAQGRDVDIARQWLHTDYVADDAGTYNVTPAADGAFAGLPDFAFDAAGEYDADFADVLAPYSGLNATVALSYGVRSANGVRSATAGGAAAVQFAAGCQRVLALGFPLEVVRPATRPAVMAAALDFLDACGMDTTIVSPEANTIYNIVPPFTGTAVGDGVSVGVQVRRESDAAFWDGADWDTGGSGTAATWLTASGSLSWTYPLPALDDGAYTLWARAVTAQPDPSPAEVAFVYDATPPLTPTLITPTGGVVMRGLNPMLRWAAVSDTDSALHYTIWLDGAIYTTTATVYTATLAMPTNALRLPHQWRVQATDAANNVGPWSTMATFMVVVAPVITITQPQAGGYYSTTPALAGTARGIGLTHVTVQLERATNSTFWDGSGWVTTSTWFSATGALAWDYAGLPALWPGDEAYVARARAHVSVGAAAETAAPFFYDKTPPLTPTLIIPEGTLYLDAPYLRWQAPPDTGSPLHYRVVVDDAVYVTTHTTYAVTLPTGVYTWQVQAVDAAGNVSPWSPPLTFEVTLRQVYLPLVLRMVNGEW